jgi:hypothetical protein
MKKVIVSLAFGASALLATAASAAPLSNGLAVVPDKRYRKRPHGL